MSDFYHCFHNAVFRHPDPDPIAECESDGMAQQIAALLNETPAAYTVAERDVLAAAYGLREAMDACNNGLAAEYVYTARKMLEDAALELVTPGQP
jgi:hypothetical protein